MEPLDQKRLLSLLARWDEPIVPDFIVDARLEMKQEIERLGPERSRELAQFLAEKTREGFEHLRVLGVFCFEYLETYREAMSAALSEQVSTDGPHTVVGLLGEGYVENMSKILIEKVRVDFDNPALINALIDALSNQADETARRFLAELPRDKLKEASVRKLDEHLAWLDAHPSYRRAK